MKHAHIILIALSTIAATGCLPGEDVFMADSQLKDGNGDGGAAPIVSPPVSPPVDLGPRVIAYEYGSTSIGSDPQGSVSVTVGSGGHNGPAPDTLFIKISNQELSCADPSERVGDCGYWQAQFQLPTELQAPGIYTLEELRGFMLFNSADDSSGFCGGGGGSFWDGTVEITSIDKSQVTGFITGSSTWEFDVNGPFVAHRCPLK